MILTCPRLAIHVFLIRKRLTLLRLATCSYFMQFTTSPQIFPPILLCMSSQVTPMSRTRIICTCRGLTTSRGNPLHHFSLGRVLLFGLANIAYKHIFTRSYNQSAKTRQANPYTFIQHHAYMVLLTAQRQVKNTRKMEK